MKRIWLVLLSLGLVMAFSVSAFAVDVKVSGEYYAAGMYLNNLNVQDKDPSSAFYFQRLRVGTDFVISPCLKFVTQFDAMERIWGGARSSVSGQDEFGAGTRAEAENIAMRLGYIDYTSPIGLFKVGYLPDYTFGTVFADRSNGPTSGQIQYFIMKGPLVGFLGYAKEVEKNYSYVSSNKLVDNDLDSYRIAGIYNFANGEAGALFLYNRDATGRAAGLPAPFLQNVYLIDPFVKAKVGPVALQAEVMYWFGDAMKWENGVNLDNVSISAWDVFLDATATFGPAYVGGTFAYLSGDKPDTTNKIEGSTVGLNLNTGGLDWNPCLMMFNVETAGYWVGNIYGYNSSVVDNEMGNAYFFQARGGVKPIPELDLMMSVSYATADQKPAGYVNSKYGTEVDLTGTYKITNNLSYMLGIGYLWTGDFFKGTSDSNSVENDYILINKLTLNF